MENTILADNNVIMVNTEKIDGLDSVTMMQTAVTLHKLCSQPKGSPYQQLQQFRKLVPQFIKGYCAMTEALQASTKQLERVASTSEENKYKRWTPEEENILIDLIASEEHSLLEVSTIMGRSAASIKTKVSNLVGVKRISKTVAGRFCGTINGETAEGFIEGVVFNGR